MKKYITGIFTVCFLFVFLFPLTSNAQPDYLSREYSFCNVFYSVTPFDSGYFLQDNSLSTIYKVNFEGDTLKSLCFQGRLPGSYSFFHGKTKDGNIIIAGRFENSNTGQSMLFISKLNFMLDTLWVRYYPGLHASGPILNNDTIAVIKKDAQSNIHVQIFNPNGELIEHRIHPKYAGSNSMTIYSIASVNARKYVIAILREYYNSWNQKYYWDPVICVSDSNQYYYFWSGFEYEYGSGASTSFIFYDNITGRIKHFYHFTQMWNTVTLYEHTLSGQLISSKGIYDDNANITGEIWSPRSMTMLGNGSFVISGQYERIYQDIKGGFIMRCGPHGEWNWFRKYKEIQTTGIGNGSLYAITETENYFLASVGQGTKAWLLVVDSLGCEAPGVCWVGEEEMPASLQIAELEVFPNPVRDEVWIKCASPLSEIEFYTMNGQRMFISALANEQPLRIDIRTWPEGLYLVRARLQNGRVLTQKMMKCR